MNHALLDYKMSRNDDFTLQLHNRVLRDRKAGLILSQETERAFLVQNFNIHT